MQEMTSWHLKFVHESVVHLGRLGFSETARERTLIRGRGISRRHADSDCILTGARNHIEVHVKAPAYGFVGNEANEIEHGDCTYSQSICTLTHTIRYDIVNTSSYDRRNSMKRTESVKLGEECGRFEVNKRE